MFPPAMEKASLTRMDIGYRTRIHVHFDIHRLISLNLITRYLIFDVISSVLIPAHTVIRTIGLLGSKEWWISQSGFRISVKNYFYKFPVLGLLFSLLFN